MHPRLTIVVVGALVLAACTPSTDPPPDPGVAAPSDPTPTPTPTPTEEAPAEPALQPPDVPTDPPAFAVAATADYRVVVVDPQTGEEVRMLASYDDPETFEEQTGEPIAAGRFFDSLVVAPDGETAYISVCCEPAPGRLFRVAVAGGGPEELAHGYEPALRADGDRIAVTELQWITILEPDGEPVTFFEPDPTVAIGIGRPAWSPDGRFVAFERYEEGLDDPELMVLDVETAAAMEDATPLPRPDGDEGQPWSRPTYDRDGRLVVAEQDLDQDGNPASAAVQVTVDPRSGEVLERREIGAGVRTQVHDASGGWLLTVFGDGSAGWQGPAGEEGSFGSGLLAAAW